MAMNKVYSTVHSMLLPWRPLGVRSLPFVKQNSLFLLYLTTFNAVHRFENSYTRRYCISEVLISIFSKKETEI